MGIRGILEQIVGLAMGEDEIEVQAAGSKLHNSKLCRTRWSFLNK